MILGFLFFIRTFFLKSIVKRLALKRIDAVNILLYYFVYSTLFFDREASAHAYYTTGSWHPFFYFLATLV